MGSQKKSASSSTTKSTPANQISRRPFLKTAVASAGAVMAPTIIPASALGLNGTVPPSERIVVGGIGIGNRGTYDLGCFLEQPDVQFVAVCDVKQKRRVAVKKIADEKYGNDNCATYRDFREPRRVRKRGGDTDIYRRRLELPALAGTVIGPQQCLDVTRHRRFEGWRTGRRWWRCGRCIVVARCADGSRTGRWHRRRTVWGEGI